MASAELTGLCESLPSDIGCEPRCESLPRIGRKVLKVDRRPEPELFGTSWPPHTNRPARPTPQCSDNSGSYQPRPERTEFAGTPGPNSGALLLGRWSIRNP